LQKCYHFDSNFAIAYLESFDLRNAKAPDQARHAAKVHRVLSGKGYEMVICDTAVGEMFKVISEKGMKIDPSDFVGQLKKGLLRIDCLDSKNLLHYGNLLNKVRKADSFLETNDVRIVTYSIVDRNCHGLLTFEKKLIESRTLVKFIRAHVTSKSKYIITEQPFPS
jgi:hypothetical protein